MQAPSTAGDILDLIQQTAPGVVLLAFRDMQLPPTAGWEAWCEAACAAVNIPRERMQARLDDHPGRWRGLVVAVGGEPGHCLRLIGGCSGDSLPAAIEQAPSLYGMLLSTLHHTNDPGQFDVDLCLLPYNVGDAGYIRRCVEQFAIMGQCNGVVRAPDTLLQPATSTRQ